MSPENTGLIRPSGRTAARVVALVATLFWALVVLFVANVRYGGDIRALLCLGEQVYHPGPLEGAPTAGPMGYDGQYYAALATDPLVRNLATAMALDVPGYRASRIGLPLLAWVLALGRPAPALVAYQLLCWGLGLAAIFLVARWLAAEGRSSWWALPLVASAGLAAAMIRSTPDAAALCLLLAALWFHAHGRFPLALAIATAAVLARETSYLAVLAMAFDELRRRRVAHAAAYAGIPLLPFLAWQAYLTSVLGAGIVISDVNFTLPFAWVGAKLPVVFSSSGIWWQEVFGLLAVVATTVAFILVASQPSAWAAPELAFLAFGALGLSLTYDAYFEAWGYGRHLIAVPFLAAVIAERRRSGWQRWALRSIVLFYLLAGLMMTKWEMYEALRGRSERAPLRATVADTGRPARVRGQPVPGPAGVPVGVRPLYVLPVANSSGRAGARWQTRLELTNLASIENRVLVELLPAGRAGSSALQATLALEPGQKRTWENALDKLFVYSGYGALRLIPLGGPVSATSWTANAAAGEPRGPLIPALGDDQAIAAGARATLRGLSHGPAREAAVRTNIGLLNLSPRPIRVRIEAYDAPARRLGQIQGDLPPRGFLQIDDVFARVRAGVVTDGSAVVETLTPGATLLAYAAVIRGPTAPVVYVFPEPTRPAAALTPK